MKPHLILAFGLLVSVPVARAQHPEGGRGEGRQHGLRPRTIHGLLSHNQLVAAIFRWLSSAGFNLVLLLRS